MCFRFYYSLVIGTHKLFILVEIFEVLSSVLNGNPSNEEKAIFNKWVSESEANKKAFKYLSKVKAERKLDHINWDKEKIWNITQGKIKESKYKMTLKLWRSIAASVAMLFLISSVFYFSNYSGSKNVANIKTLIPHGITSTIELSDGSIVHLNSGSELQYPSTFNGGERKVILSGEAYFEIAKDEEKPFIVATNEIDIRVLGTKFNVQSYSDHSEITTTLIEGSVSIKNSKEKSIDKEIILEPNYRATFNRSDGKFQVKKVGDALAYTKWINGHYFFEDEQFSSIVKKLERGFNVNIKVHVERMKQERYTGMFDNDESLYEILDIMKLKRGFVYHTSKDTLHIINKN